MAIKALLFDLDGTLLDSLDSWVAGINDSLKKHDCPLITREQFINSFWGRDREFYRKKIGYAPEILEDCIICYGNYLSETKLYPDALRTLDLLGDYKKGIVTNNQHLFTEKIIRIHDLERYFPVALGADDVEHPKPSPDMMLKASELLAVMPEETIVIGDMDIDIESAHRAGMKAIGVNQPNADYVIERLEEIPALLKKIQAQLLTKKHL